MSEQNSIKLPDKRYCSISEVADIFGLEQHVLRYWEQEFPTLSPAKRSGNRRKYTRDDILVVQAIQDLLYNQRFTIDGARRQLAIGKTSVGNSSNQSGRLADVVVELEGMLVDLG